MHVECTFADALRDCGRTLVELVPCDGGRWRFSRVGYTGSEPWCPLTYPSKAEAIRVALSRYYLIQEPGRLLPIGIRRTGYQRAEYEVP